MPLSIYKNLRVYRKRGQLIQEDIAFISAMPDFGNVSRMENGLREPTLELLLLYHLLFEMPIDSLFGDIVSSVKGAVVERIKLRLEYLRAAPPNPKFVRRIATLDGALKRLNPTK